MVSNYDDKALRTEISEGKRHFQKQKKTSLFGSESPRTPKSKSNHNRYTNPETDTNRVEDNILSQNEILRRERERQDNKQKSVAEKRATLKELESYDPWSKPGAGAPNVTQNPDQNGNRSKWEYEQELKRVEEYKNSDEKQYPGFPAGFGCGNVRKDGRRRSETSSVNEETKQNIYYPFGSPGGGAPITDDKRKNQGASVTIHRNEVPDNDPRQKLEEAQAYADHLEQEIQRMKLRQLEDKYSPSQNNYDETRHDQPDHNVNHEYEDDALYREAENRARLRELERLKESYEQSNDKYNAESMNNERRDEYSQDTNEVFLQNSKEIPRVPLHQTDSRRSGSSSTHNDYRPYSMEEYMNSRQQQVNPSQLKRTTLSGSEEVYRNGNVRNGDSNHNFKLINEDNIMKQQNNPRTYNNIFPSEQKYSSTKVTGPYSMKAPYATD